MDLAFQLKKEPIDNHFVISTTDNKTPIHEYSTEIIFSEEASNAAIKQEPESDLNESEYCEDVDEDSETEQTQQDIETAGQKALSTLFPDKSKEYYQKAYDKFKGWCYKQKINEINEKALVTYFATELEGYKATSTWTIYSMLNSTLSINDNIQISGFQNLRALLKRKSDGYNAKQSITLKKDEVFRFIKEAPNDQFLAVKVILIVGVYGACSREELIKMSIDDIECIDGGIKVIIPGPKRQLVIERQFVIAESGDSDVNIVDIVKRYINLRPDDVPNSRFFINYRQGKCTRQPIGINTISKYPGKIASFLGLPNPNDYTGHCFRRSSAAFLLDAGISTSVKRHGCWSSDKAQDNDVESSLNNKRKISVNISGQKVAKLDGQSSPKASTRISSIYTPEAEDPLYGVSSEDDAEATNSTISKSIAKATKYEDISDLETNDRKNDPHLEILKKIFERQVKQTEQLEKMNENLQKLIEVITENIY